MQTSGLPAQPSVASDLGQSRRGGTMHPNRVPRSCQHCLPGREACHIQKSMVWSSHFASKQRHNTCSRLRVVTQASSSSRQRNIQQIPIFPLGMVALPGAVTPLNIFEARFASELLRIVRPSEEIQLLTLH